MANEVTILIYKPSTQSTEEYVVVINPVEYEKYKKGDTSVAPALIVDSFDVFHCSTGHTGKLGKASKQQLETAFGSSKDDKVIEFMLKNGERKSGNFGSKYGDRNDSRTPVFINQVQMKPYVKHVM
ncbi:FYSH domain-containing protein [Ceratobasidium sp. AG-I]|nr:FYSH domain-containing protein [Ceratobasidium sp. AG-I]